MVTMFHSPGRLVFTGDSSPVSEMECNDPAFSLTGDSSLVAEVVMSLWIDELVLTFEEVDHAY